LKVILDAHTADTRGFFWNVLPPEVQWAVVSSWFACITVVGIRQWPQGSISETNVINVYLRTNNWILCISWQCLLDSWS